MSYVLFSKMVSMKFSFRVQWCFLFLTCTAAARIRQERLDTADATVTVRTFWIRHGLSCANIVREFTPLFAGIVSQHFYGDPSLTDCAIAHAQALGPQFEAKIRAMHQWDGPLPIFSSVLVRSIETALHNFREQDVYPIPYIAELGREADNMPFPWTSENDTDDETQVAKLGRQSNKDHDIKRIRFLPLVNPSDDPERTGEHKADYAKFIEEFPKILEYVVPEERIVNNTVIPVVIVSHSGFMLKNLQCLSSKPRNNEVWVKDYSMTMRKLSEEDRNTPRSERPSSPMVEKKGCGEELFPHKSYPKYDGVSSLGGLRSRPCKADIMRCGSSWMPRGWGSNEESCCPSVHVSH